MGFFTNDRPATGSVFAQARVLGVNSTGMSREIAGRLPEQKVEFTLEVRVEGWGPYLATARHFLPITELARFGSGTTFLAVWVDPLRPEKVVVDLTQPPPVVTSAPAPGVPGAAAILATGVPADAVIQSFTPLPLRDQHGSAMFAFALVVMVPGMQPYMVQVGNAAPPAAYPLLFPGSRVPVRLGPTASEVVIDWGRALACTPGPASGRPQPVDLVEDQPPPTVR